MNSRRLAKQPSLPADIGPAAARDVEYEDDVLTHALTQSMPLGMPVSASTEGHRAETAFAATKCGLPCTR